MGVKVRERPKGSGVYWVFINHQGKRKAKKAGEKKTAIELAKKLEAKIVLKEFGFAEDARLPSFAQYSGKWLDEYIGPLRAPSTRERYEGVLKHVLPFLGAKPINEVSRGDIRAMILELKKRGFSRSHLCLVRDVTSGPLGYALDEELIATNPAAGVLRRMNLDRSRQRPLEPMTAAEAWHFLEICAQSEPEHYAFFLCALRTGMRLGELLALRWGDIDWFGNFIRVERSFKRGRISQTKTGRVRRVDMSDQLAATLKTLLAQGKRQALQQGRGEPPDIVFHRGGAHMEQNFIRRVFKKLLQRSGLREMRVHDIRHTFASLLLNNGESPVYVKEQLGHSSIKMTVDIYGHLIPGANREAVNRLDCSVPRAAVGQVQGAAI